MMGGLVLLFFKKEIEKKICPCLFSQFTLLYTQSVAGGAVGVLSLALLCGDINMNALKLNQPPCIPQLCLYCNTFRLRATIRLYSPS